MFFFYGTTCLAGKFVYGTFGIVAYLVGDVSFFGDISFTGEASFFGANMSFLTGSESFFPIDFILSRFSAGFFIGFTKEGAYNFGVNVGFLTNVC